MTKIIAPLFITMLCGTITYPIAVRVVKRVFKLRGFYAIHLSIAPFLAIIHTNVFAVSHSYFMIKHMEKEFDSVKHLINNEQEY